MKMVAGNLEAFQMLWSQGFLLMVQDGCLCSRHQVWHQVFPATREEIGMPTFFKGTFWKSHTFCPFHPIGQNVSCDHTYLQMEAKKYSVYIWPNAQLKRLRMKEGMDIDWGDISYLCHRAQQVDLFLKLKGPVYFSTTPPPRFLITWASKKQPDWSDPRFSVSLSPSDSEEKTAKRPEE